MIAPPSILVVEDEAMIRMGLIETLESGGFTVEECSNGAEAIAFIAHASQLQGLVTDVRLGEGPDGWEIAHHARRKFPNLPVVYMTGDSSADWTAEGVPGSVMLQKPFAEAQMLTAIANRINESGPGP